MGCWGPVGQFSIRQFEATESYSSRAVFHSLWGMKMADHNLLDLSYSLSFTLEHTLNPTSQPSQRATFTPRHFLLSMGCVDLNWWLFSLNHVTSVRSIYNEHMNNSDFSLSLVHSKANPQRLRLESYFIKVCKCWWGLLAAIPLHVCVYVLKGALELPSNVAVINTNFFLQTVAPC